ncbi:twin-arginine translocase TatA/TatE family subunit [Novosphingobium aerophilum]|uniref:twin-arginine translocase TatA/TatE family subunit n=1 Tax=Novosphingobium aerophilum TaxID=2839843 RepID=UPI001BE45307|nr:twin-arginine translocase TatA/TatE family subunit [Novosphingobium aerophilum]
MGLSLPHLLIVALVVLVLFGRGRISEMMGDFGKGIKSFKQGMADDETARPAPPAAQIPPAQIPPAAAPTEAAQQPSGDQLPR